ncbi:hypothetical protein AAHC03_0783 [Spirometra sp. Aus1]
MSAQDIALEKLQVTGYKCTLFDDPEKYLDISLGNLLVPALSDPSLLIDRYDCRGYLQDFSDYDADNVVRRSNLQTEEDAALEELCDYERYLELEVDVHEVATLQEEDAKRECEAARSSYTAVDFTYEAEDAGSQRELDVDRPKSASDNIPPKPEESDSDMTSSARTSDNAPYVCPPELVLPPYMVLPQSDRQAAIIERTAVFIARNSTQMEIVLKAKQASNSQFQFLNYDSELNPFYKELVKLIKAGRYFPKIRQLPETNSFAGDGQTDPINSVSTDEPYQLKLPKVDISNTAYASLINRFKKSNEDKLAASSPTSSAAADSPKDAASPASHSQSGEECRNSTSGHDKSASSEKPSSVDKDLATSSKSSTVTNGFSALDYEQCYQNYYKHYYAYYYIQLARSRVGSKKITSDLGPEESASLVQEAAKAAASAASSAVNAIHQSSNSPSVEQRVIIDKMAEYVARNGEEFEEIVKNQKKGDPRLAFLRPGHLFHAYYQSKKAEIMGRKTKRSPTKQSSSEKPAVGSPKSGQAPTATKSTNDSVSSKKTSMTAISFRLSKSASSGRLKGLAGESEPLTNAADSNSSNSEPKGDRPLSPSIRLSGSCSLLPGMNSYSSDSEGEESPPPTPITTPIRDEPKEELMNMETSNEVPANPALAPPGITIFGPLPMAQASPQIQPGVLVSPLVDDQSLAKAPAAPLVHNSTEPPRRSPSLRTQYTAETKDPTPPPRTHYTTATLFSEVSKTPVAAPPSQADSLRSESCKKTSPPTAHVPLVEPPTTVGVTSSPQRAFTPPDEFAILTREFRSGDSPDTRETKLSCESVDRLGSIPSPPAPTVSAAEQARLQRERRQRAALLVARIKRDRESQSGPTVKVPISGSASPPPPPQSVPNAVARDVIAQLRLQRERALAAQAEEEAKIRKKKYAKCPPSAYAIGSNDRDSPNESGGDGRKRPRRTSPSPRTSPICLADQSLLASSRLRRRSRSSSSPSNHHRKSNKSHRHQKKSKHHRHRS